MHPVIQITQNVLTHGEHDGFRSVVALINETPSPYCYLTMIMFFIKHEETPIGLQLILGILANFILHLGGGRAKHGPECKGAP